MVQSREELEKVNKVVTAKFEYSEARRELEDKFLEYYDMFNGILPEGESYPWRSKIFMKETFKVIDTIHPVFMDMLFMQGDPFRVKGQDGQVDEAQAKVLERVLKIYLEKMDAYNTLDDFITELLVYGTAFTKMYWNKDVIEYEVEEEKEEPVPGVMGKLGKKKKKKYKEKKQRVIIDNPVIDLISYKDIFFPTRAKDLQKCAVIHRTWRSLDALKKINEQKGIYKNLDELERIASSNRNSDKQEQDTKDQQDDLGLSENAEIAKSLDMNESGEYEILEYWYPDNSGFCTIAGGQVIIRESDNPFKHKKKPFIWANYKRRPDSIWGIGVCELARDGQEFLNTSVNQAIDSNSLANNLMVICARDAEIDDNDLIARPGGRINVDREVNERVQDKIQQLRFTKIDTSAEIGLATREILEVTGASRLMQGTYESGAVRNTSQARLIMASSQKKFLGKILTFENMFLKPFVRTMFALMQQYLTQDVVVNMIGEDGMEYVKVSPVDILKDIDFMPVGSRQLVEMEQAVHQMNNFLAVASGIPYAAAMVNFRYLLTKIWNNMSPDHDGSKVVLTDEEASRALQELMAAQQFNIQGNTMGGMGQAPQPALGGMNPSQPNMAGGVQG